MKYVFLAPVVNDFTHERSHCFPEKLREQWRAPLLPEQTGGFIKHTQKKTSYFRFPSLYLLKLLE